MNFSDLSLEPALLRAVADLGFTTATPIQQKALPPAIAGHDVLACAMTGSGKTAAFALPILQRLGSKPSQGATRALVLTPTRELAAQVHEHLVALGKHTRITATTVFGGVSPFPQERALRRGVDVVVATPGRLLDLMGQGAARFDQLEILVLDEADRMLDMGFLPDVERILKALPRQRQTMLFSATMPRPIVELSKKVLANPTRLDVERQAAPATGVTQEILPVPENLKPALLLHMLRSGELQTALVFTRTKHRANRLADFLQASKIACDRIHGNRSQGQREAALAAFKSGKLQVLVATDIAARGIDIAELPHVVNFDVPNMPEDYIHRVGRTARASSTGDALTFAAPQEANELNAIERAVGRRIARRQVEGFDYNQRPAQRFEVPIAERIAEIRARKADERARAKAKAERKASSAPGGRPTARPAAAKSGAAPAGRPAAPRGAGSNSPWPGREARAAGSAPPPRHSNPRAGHAAAPGGATHGGQHPQGGGGSRHGHGAAAGHAGGQQRPAGGGRPGGRAGDRRPSRSR
jgi:ATP-dependent RNA helicase RhlE